MTAADPPQSLRRRIARGGTILVGRIVLGAVLSLVSVVLITREIGPASYGVYVGAQAFVVYAEAVARLGIDAYLMRKEGEPTRSVYGYACLIMLGSSAAMVLLAVGALLALSHWLGGDFPIAPYLVILMALPAANLRHPALAFMQRELNYRGYAAVELAGHAVYAAVGVTLAYLGFGVWAPVIGYVSLSWCAFALAWQVSGLRPQFRWSPEAASDMLRYGVGYASSRWMWELRNLVNPVVVGGMLGVEAVAVVALAAKAVQVLTSIRMAALQLSLVAMAKVQQDVARSTRMVEEAMLVQTMLLGPVLGGFALGGPWLLSKIYSPEWLELFVVYPFIAMGALVNGIFNMQASQLYVRARNLDVATSYLIHVSLFAGAAFLLVRPFGVVGYGYAELIALAAYMVLHQRLLRFLRVAYAEVVPWLVASFPPLFVPLTGLAWAPILWLPLLIVALTPRSRRQLQDYAALVFARLR